MPKVAINYKNGVQKGPATDASMLTEMKRKQLSVVAGRQPVIVGKPNMTLTDHQMHRGFTNGVVPFYFNRGVYLNFLNYR